MTHPIVTLLRTTKKDEVIKFLASDGIPPVTAVIIWSFLYGRLTLDLIKLADLAENEDTSAIRALRNCNTDMNLSMLQNKLMPHVIDFLDRELNLIVDIAELKEEEIFAMIEEEKQKQAAFYVGKPKFVYEDIPHDTEPHEI